MARLAVALAAVGLVTILGWWGIRRWPAFTAPKIGEGAPNATANGNKLANGDENPTLDVEVRSTATAPLLTPRMAATIDQEVTRLDPAKDGWDSEAVTETASKQLKSLALVLSQPGDLTVSQLQSLCSSSFASPALVPDLVETYRDRRLAVLRAPGDSQSPIREAFHGQQGAAQALRELHTPFADSEDIDVRFKLFRIRVEQDRVWTKVFYDAVGRTSTETIQQSAVWNCQWETTERSLVLVRVDAEEFEQIVWEGGRPLFADCTAAVLGKNESFHEQIQNGLNHWLARIEVVHGMDTFGRCGIAVGDVNGDGLDDVYLCQPGGLPNRLYIQNSDGSASDGSRQAGVDWLNHTSSALFVDLDNDGDQDLALAMPDSVLIMENESAGQFHLRADLPTGARNVHALSAIDFNVDGRLDLFLTVAMADLPDDGDARPFVYHDATDGGPNRLYRSTGLWQFSEVTREVGLDDDNHRHSLAASWEDFDNDGDPDLYVANDYGPNCLYRNDEGKFKNVADEAGVLDFASGMSVSWGDYDRDGLVDLYVGNMFSNAGNRITSQAEFMPTADETTRGRYARFAKGNTLFKNIGQGRFRDVGALAGVEMGRWSWSSLFADLNNDGWDDLVVANGYITTDDPGDL